MAEPSIELVVARHTEDLRWLRRLPNQIRATVYDKGGGVGAPAAHLPRRAALSTHPLPNIGREAHTYLHHIVERFEDLAEVTVFAQGKPFDHVSTFHRTVRDLAEGTATVTDFTWLGFIIDWDDATGSRLFQNWTKNPRRDPLDMDGFSRAVWNRPATSPFIFFPGAHFAVTRSTIRRQPRMYYERALDVAGTFTEAAHCFERCWDRVFGVDGLPSEHRGRPLPIYTKPIRRLLDAG